MKIDVDKDTIKMMYYLGILKHTSEKHKNHHVALVAVSDDMCTFECLDCEETFKSKLV